MADPKRLLSLLALLALAGCVAPAAEEAAPAPSPAAPETAQPTVGGAAMDPAAAILSNLAKSSDHRSLVAAFRSGGIESLPGPVTLFAPTDTAFAKLPPGTMETLATVEARRVLTDLLRYHVVPGAKRRSNILAEARANGGTVTYRTLQGGSIRVSAQGDSLTLTDVHGNRGAVTIADVRNSDGVVHVVDTVLLPTP